MKVKTTIANRNRLTSELDLFSDEDIPEETKEEVRNEVGNFLREQILLSVADSATPISGGAFKSSLSKKYRAAKEADNLPGIANLELTGEMLDSLDFRSTNAGIELGVFGRAALRADGHNNFTGESRLPLRQFLPKVGQNFKRSIASEVDKIIRDKKAEGLNVSRRTFATVQDREQLWDLLRELLPGMSRVKIVETVTRSQEIFGLLNEFNLTRFL